MFTGIVEEMGSLVGRTSGEGYDALVIAGEKVMSDLGEGHSICVNGVCLTVVERTGEYFTVHVIPETLRKSNLGDLAPGGRVNLERAMGTNDRFHGHVVQGHVETVGNVVNVTADGGDVRMTVELGKQWLRYCIPKGSIALDGVSLTIAELSSSGVTVALIPYTLARTTLGSRQVGDTVNVETDIFARYLERFLEAAPDEGGANVDLERLRELGFGEE